MRRSHTRSSRAAEAAAVKVADRQVDEEDAVVVEEEEETKKKKREPSCQKIVSIYLVQQRCV